MVHADAVGNRDGCELARRATGFRDPLLRGLDLEIMSHVAGRLLALHADDPDHGLGKRGVVESHRAHEGAMRRPIKPVDGYPGSQFLHTHVSPEAAPVATGTLSCLMPTRLLQRRNDGRMLELSDIQF